MIKIGDRFPELNLLTNQGEINISSFKGKNIVLYFYPKDNTPGCTLEANDFNALHEQFLATNTIVLGVSKDSIKAHQKFCNKYHLVFPLVSDQDESLCKLFHVLNEVSIFGKKIFNIISRSTFLFNKDNVLIKEWRSVKIRQHASQVLEYIRGLDQE